MASHARQPNILFFFSDQQRWDTAGCYGQKLPITPHLDRMAAEGVRFDLAFTSQPVCGPARACLQTGKYATETGCWCNGIALPKNEMTLPRWLSAAGYEVGYIGKWHLASTVREPVPPDLRGGYKDFWLASDVLEHTSHGYDGHMWDGDMKQVDFKGYRVDCQTDFVLNYLRTRDRKRPWFLFLSYIEPHHQNDHNRFEGPEGSKERFKDYVVPGDLVGTKGDWRENFPDYLGCCNSLDTGLGRIRDELDKLRMADNTLILYTSDHGCHFRTRNSEYKRSCHEGCTHVPLVVCGPGFRNENPNLCPGADPTATGKVVRHIVSLIDLPPTVLAAAGAAVPAGMRGRPLQGLADGTTKDWRDEAFIQISESQTGRALRTPKWKYSVSAPGKKSAKASELYAEEFLYDLDKDPHERNNLVKDPALADVRLGLAERLKARIVEAGEKPATIEPAA
jgi:uncharacterized sulfatase